MAQTPISISVDLAAGAPQIITHPRERASDDTRRGLDRRVFMPQRPFMRRAQEVGVWVGGRRSIRDLRVFIPGASGSATRTFSVSGPNIDRFSRFPRSEACNPAHPDYVNEGCFQTFSVSGPNIDRFSRFPLSEACSPGHPDYDTFDNSNMKSCITCRVSKHFITRW